MITSVLSSGHEVNVEGLGSMTPSVLSSGHEVNIEVYT